MDQQEGVVKRMDLGVVFRPRAMVRLQEFVFKRFVNYFQQRLTQTVDSHLANFFIVCFTAVDCGPLSAPMNGSSSGDSTAFPNSVQFNCDPGFILSGSFSRICQANGTWSGAPTLCVGRSVVTIVERNPSS